MTINRSFNYAHARVNDALAMRSCNLRYLDQIIELLRDADRMLWHASEWYSVLAEASQEAHATGEDPEDEEGTTAFMNTFQEAFDDLVFLAHDRLDDILIDDQIYDELGCDVLDCEWEGIAEHVGNGAFRCPDHRYWSTDAVPEPF
jgi:hypothetical protein